MDAAREILVYIYRENTEGRTVLEQLADDSSVPLVGRFEQRRPAILQNEAHRL